MKPALTPALSPRERGNTVSLLGNCLTPIPVADSVLFVTRRMTSKRDDTLPTRQTILTLLGERTGVRTGINPDLAESLLFI